MSADFHRAECEHCHSGIEFPGYAEGTQAKCPHCGNTTLLCETAKPEPPKLKSKQSRKLWIVVALSVVFIAGIVTFSFVWLVPFLAADFPFLREAAGGIAGCIVLACLVAWLMLWLLFPVFVYFALERLKTQIGTTNAILREILDEVKAKSR